jgi:hypothetical protein
MPLDVLAWLNDKHPELLGYIRFNGPTYMAGLKLTLVEPERFNDVLTIVDDKATRK